MEDLARADASPYINEIDLQPPSPRDDSNLDIYQDYTGSPFSNPKQHRNYHPLYNALHQTLPTNHIYKDVI